MKLDTLNKLEKDNFGRISGILVLNKDYGMTSHDLVEKIRKKLKIKKVGHAGALDPFATGLMIILVGKSTKLSLEFLNLDKEYKFEVLFGVSTDTQDIEGKVLDTLDNAKVSKFSLEKVLKDFKKNHHQRMPIFSSIKIGGVRLREFARASTTIEKFEKGNIPYVRFLLKPETKIYKKVQSKLSPKGEIEIKIPERSAKIHDIELINLKDISGKETNLKVPENLKFKIATIKARVSKGTYIRQLAEDIGQRLGNIPAMLYSLERTKIGEITKKNVMALEGLST